MAARLHTRDVTGSKMSSRPRGGPTRASCASSSADCVPSSDAAELLSNKKGANRLIIIESDATHAALQTEKGGRLRKPNHLMIARNDTTRACTISLLGLPFLNSGCPLLDGRGSFGYSGDACLPTPMLRKDTRCRFLYRFIHSLQKPTVEDRQSWSPAKVSKRQILPINLAHYVEFVLFLRRIRDRRMSGLQYVRSGVRNKTLPVRHGNAWQ